MLQLTRATCMLVMPLPQTSQKSRVAGQLCPLQGSWTIGIVQFVRTRPLGTRGKLLV